MEHRKGWTRKGDTFLKKAIGAHLVTALVGSRLIVLYSFAGNDYEVYPQPKTPAIDMQAHLETWIDLLEGKVLRRPLLPDEYLFPHISPNGQVNAAKPMDYEVFQELLHEFAASAGLDIKFSTHCFRRGGPQYRFMHCPLGERWSLSMIKWWAAWAEGEQVRN